MRERDREERETEERERDREEKETEKREEQSWKCIFGTFYFPFRRDVWAVLLRNGRIYYDIKNIRVILYCKSQIPMHSPFGAII